MGLVIRNPIAAAAIVAFVAAVGWLVWSNQQSDRQAPIVLGHGDYVLEGTDGQPFTRASLNGKPSAIFFGFTHCPDVCPTTLADIALWQDELGADADKLRYFFVTVDPERDTADMLDDYVGWVPNTVGVTGSVAEIEKAQSAFRIYAERVPLSDGEYSMDHSAYVMLFDSAGEFVEIIPYQTELADVMKQLNRLLGA